MYACCHLVGVKLRIFFNFVRILTKISKEMICIWALTESHVRTHAYIHARTHVRTQNTDWLMMFCRKFPPHLTVSVPVWLLRRPGPVTQTTVQKMSKAHTHTHKDAHTLMHGG